MKPKLITGKANTTLENRSIWNEEFLVLLVNRMEFYSQMYNILFKPVNFYLVLSDFIYPHAQFLVDIHLEFAQSG